MKVKSEISLIKRAKKNQERTAIITQEGVFSYGDLLEASGNVAASLIEEGVELSEARVAYLIPAGFQNVAVQWGIWRAGGIAVPLCVYHSRPELEYVIENSDSTIIFGHPDFEVVLRPIIQALDRRFLLSTAIIKTEHSKLPDIDKSRRAMILYTSGTTGKPKGVVITHKNIESRSQSLVSAWGWSPDDHILNVLPLHHVHGITNVVTCALWSGAKCEMLQEFDAEKVWRYFLKGDLTLFMAVPTIYVKLIAYWESVTERRQKEMSASCTMLRLMVSGSAALSVGTFDKWKEISGHILLERYGMTEVGMALSNPLHGQRCPGFVGTPLPNIEVRLVDENGKTAKPGTQGEIQVRGPGVFHEYWNDRISTKNAFSSDWFSTGDIAVIENGIYRILGRKSLDIIKTGGYKVSALEVENVIRTHPNVAECAIVGINDLEWGERVSAALVLKKGTKLPLASLRSWGKGHLAAYKIPNQIKIIDELPRDILGKISKKTLAGLFTESVNNY